MAGPGRPSIQVRAPDRQARDHDEIDKSVSSTTATPTPGLSRVTVLLGPPTQSQAHRDCRAGSGYHDLVTSTRAAVLSDFESYRRRLLLQLRAYSVLLLLLRSRTE